jgi:spermidine synthase
LVAEEYKVFVRGNGERVSYKVDEVVDRKRTQFQQVEVLRTEPYGLSVFLDGEPQSAQIDEFIYHEALVHPAMVTVPSPRRVFIAGGGEGATLREVLRHNTVERVVMVDIDGEATALFRKHLLDWHRGGFDDPRVELRHEDARAYLEGSDETFDCVVIDITDPLMGGPAYLLFTEEFYRLVASRLSPEGAMVTQAECFAYNDLEGHLSIAKTLGRVFPNVMGYGEFIPYFSDTWGFAVAAKQVDSSRLAADEVDRRLAERGCSGLRYYDGETHRSLVYQPKFYREMLAAWQRIITDSDPFYVIRR